MEIGDQESAERLDSMLNSDEGKKLAMIALKATIASLVTQGIIDTENKTFEEVLVEGAALVQQLAADPEADFTPIIDHKQALLDAAARAVQEGHNELGVLMLATWFEHWINNFLRLVLIRNRVSQESIDILLRELKFRTKFTVMWELLSVPELEAEHLAAIQSCMDRRNEFAHYKWRPVVDNHAEVLGKVIERALRAVERLQTVESEALYGGLYRLMVEHRDSQ